MREICDLRELRSRLANPFGHPSQVRSQVLVLQTCVDFRRLASPLGEGLTQGENVHSKLAYKIKPGFEYRARSTFGMSDPLCWAKVLFLCTFGGQNTKKVRRRHANETRKELLSRIK